VAANGVSSKPFNNNGLICGAGTCRSYGGGANTSEAIDGRKQKEVLVRIYRDILKGPCADNVQEAGFPVIQADPDLVGPIQAEMSEDDSAAHGKSKVVL